MLQQLMLFARSIVLLRSRIPCEDSSQIERGRPCSANDLDGLLFHVKENLVETYDR